MNPGYVEEKAPEILGVQYQKQTVNKGGSITCGLNIKTNGKKLRTIALEFYNEKRQVSAASDNAEIREGMKEYSFSVLDHKASGEYYLESIELWDVTNRVYWYTLQNGQFILTHSWMTPGEGYQFHKEFALNYQNSDYGFASPVVESVSLNSNYVKSPGKVQMTIKVKKSADIDWIRLCYQKNNGLKKTLEISRKEANQEVLTFVIPRYFFGGEYHLTELSIRDIKGNNTDYFRTPYSEKWNDGVLEEADFGATVNESYESFKAKLDLQVQMEDAVEFLIDGNNPSLLSKLKDLPNGKTAIINYAYGYPTVPKSVFESIAGMNKTIVLENSGIQWVFDGKDITKERCKDIDINTSVYTTSGVPYGSTEDVVVMVFPNNGKLPGKATMRIQSDYAEHLYQIKGKLYLIYVNGEEQTVIQCEPKPETDGYLCFPIEHNSTYILSPNLPKDVQGSLEKEYILFAENTNQIYATQTKSLYLVYDKSKDGIKSVTSSNPSVVKVSQTGKVTGVKKGTATVTLNMKSGLKVSTKVSVLIPKVSLNAKSIPLQLKKTTTALKINTKYSADSVKKWYTSSKRIVEVNSRTGKLKAKKKGTATIKVLMKSGATATCRVKVQKQKVRVSRLEFGTSTVRVKKGKSVKVKIDKKPITATDSLRFRTRNKNIATVSSKGIVKGKKRGKTRLEIAVGKESYRYSLPIVVQ